MDKFTEVKIALTPDQTLETRYAANCTELRPKRLTQHHAQIFVGDGVSKKLKSSLIQKFCKDNGCEFCTECKKINENRHPFVIWLNQEKSYTLEDIEPIFEKTKFKSESNQDTFFIIENAQNLSDVCSNRLLKTLEEPENGYYFILLTNNINFILPTIRSRSIVVDAGSELGSNDSTLSIFFKNENLNANEFLDYLYKNSIDERMTSKILEEILIYWINENKKSQSKKKFELINLFSDGFKNLPMPGGSKLFWKNIYTKYSLIAR